MPQTQHWKQKASLLASRYYEELQDLRNQLVQLREKTVKEASSLHEDFDKTLESVIGHYTKALKEKDRLLEMRPKKKFIRK